MNGYEICNLMDGRKTVNGAYRQRYAPFSMPICSGIGSWLSLWESCRRRRLRGKKRAAASSAAAGFAGLSECRPANPNAARWESAFLNDKLNLFTLSVLALLGHLSQRERQEMHALVSLRGIKRTTVYQKMKS